MMGMSLGHLIILAVIVLLFGPKKMSSLAEQLGRSVRNIRDQLDNVKETTGVADIEKSWNAVREDANELKKNIDPSQAHSDKKRS